jgi:general secretion pathway protein A
MHEEYYGFSERPFSPTPDPKYFYRSESHANALDLLHHAIGRREGLVVVTGEVGTGKTTLCQAILEQLDRRTFSALVLNPFLSEEDLLRRILQQFGVVSRDESRRGQLAGVSTHDLTDTLHDFLLSLRGLRAGALLVVDEAQDLPHQALEQLRILSNLETAKEKLLQIVLVGQSSLNDVLGSPGLRQLDQRVSFRYALQPLTRDETAAYVAHRLTVAGGSAGVKFTRKSLDCLHRHTGGVPRLVNRVCDRALLRGYTARTDRITPGMVTAAAGGLELAAPRVPFAGWAVRHAASFAAGAVLTATVMGAAWYGVITLQARSAPPPAVAEIHAAAAPAPAPLPAPRPAPAGAVTAPAQPIATSGSALSNAPAQPFSARAPEGPSSGRSESAGRTVSVVVGSFRRDREAAALLEQLRGLGYQVRTRRAESEASGVWQQVLVGPYTDMTAARQDEARVRQLPGYGDARLTTH